MNRRDKFREGLSQIYLPYYDKLCGLLDDSWQPICGIRTFKEQAELYSRGRSRPGNVVTKAKAGTSAHNYGCASDWVKFSGGIPQWKNKNDPMWDEYYEACLKAGVRTLGFEAVHNELTIDCCWGDVLWEFEQKGCNAAQEFIKLHHKIRR